MNFYINNARYIHPKTTNCRIIKKVDETMLFYRYSFSGKIIIEGDDYDYIKTLTGVSCDIVVNKGLKDTRYPELAGQLSFKGDFDEKRKRVDLSIILEDQYNTILNNEEYIVNIANCQSVNLSVPYRVDDYFHTLKTLTRAKILSVVIEYILSQIDNTITVDAYTFSAFFTNNARYSNIVLEGISDFVLDSTTDEQKVYAATVVNITWKQLYEYLQKKHYIYWYITTDKKLRLYHLSEVGKTVDTSIDFTNHIGTNWSNNKYTYNTAKAISQIVRKEIAHNTDFVGTDIKFPNINQKQIETYEFNNFYHDVDGTRDNKSLFPEDSTDGIVMLSCNTTVPKIEQMISSFVNPITNPIDYFNFENNTLTGNHTNIALPVDVPELISNETAYTGVQTIYLLTFDYNINLVSESANSRFQIFLGNFPFNIELTLSGTGSVYETLLVGSASTFNIKMTVSISLWEAGDSVDFTLSNIRLKRYEAGHTVRIAWGVLSGQNRANNDFSTANLDEFNRFLIEFPDSWAYINNIERTNLLVTKQKEPKEFECPLSSIDDIDFDKLYKHNLGNIEVSEISMPVSKGSIAKIKSKF